MAGRHILLGLSFVFCAGWAHAGVVISEIHYHPPSPHGKTLEFVEVHNSSDNEIAIGGWRFAGGIRFTFPGSARLPAGGYVVVCRDRDEFTRQFLVRKGVLGDFEGSLDNGGEEIVLTDGFNAVIDAVRYDDERPWPAFADGRGASLQRVCADAPSHRYDNWTGAPVDAPSPLAWGSRNTCPLPPRPVPAVVISEINYHPLNDRDELEEYVELHNPGEGPVALAGWKFDEGIDFTFPDGTSIDPGEYLVVCRNQERIRDVFATDDVVGNFSGQLSNRGERVVLVDGAGQLVDFVAYRDQGEWDYGADGEGRSLEKIVLTGHGEDPANWGRSFFREPDPQNSDDEGFIRVETAGYLSNQPGQKIVLGIDGAGEFILDNVVFERVDTPGNLLPNGDFEAGPGDWVFRGVADGSAVEADIGVGDSQGLRLVSSGECATDPCGGADSVSYTFDRGSLTTDVEYRLSLSFRYVSGSSDIYARMLQGVEISFDRASLSPGRGNTIARESQPPHISHRGRFPEEPTPLDSVWLSARVRAAEDEGAPEVWLTYFLGDAEEPNESRVQMFDDGAHGDGLPADGVYGVEIPSFPHGSQVRYQIEALSTGGVAALSPVPLDPGAPRSHEVWGYYVVDAVQPPSRLPVYHVLVPGVNQDLLRLDPQFINGNQFLNCYILRRGSFAFRGELYPDVGIRWRGNTACFIQKRNFKLKFNRGRDFRDVRKVNLQGLWTDKTLLRERLAWEFVRELGAPYCETEYIRVHLNGLYHGLFLYLEHPDQRFLRRLGLDPSGCLYKARQPDVGGNGRPIGVEKQDSLLDYERFWERETCESEDLAMLGDFIDRMHADEEPPRGPTREFYEDNTFEEWLIDYQVAQVVLDNIDSFAKNHFLYRSSEEGRWGLITWDMDLVLGKFFDRAVVDRFPDGERPVGTLNDCVQCPGGDLNPWFGAAVNGEPVYHHWVDKFFRAGDGFYQRSYLVRLWDVIQEKYSNEVYDPILDEMVESLRRELDDDLARWGRYVSNPGCVVPDEIEPNVEIIKQQIDCHRNGLGPNFEDPEPSLIPYFEEHHPEVMIHPRMKITEIMYDPEGRGEDREFIELMNTSGEPIDVSLWGFHEGIVFFFAPGTVIDTDEIIIVAHDPRAFRDRYPDAAGTTRIFGPFLGGRISNEGEVLRLKDAGPGFPATIDYVEYDDGGLWPEGRDGHSLELTGVAPNRDNDRPENWRLSPASGGTPGRLPLSSDFVRGDVDRDGRPTINDAVMVFRYLFQGGEEPECFDAADVDDDSNVFISDPVFLLNFLFRRFANPIPAPFPTPGPDPTPDELSCF